MSALHVVIQREAEFVLVLARVAAILAAIPVVGGLSVPNIIKVWLAVAVALALVPVVAPAATAVDPWSAGIGLLGETMIGLAIGLAIRLVFAAVDMGAELAGLQMGFGLAMVFDPSSGRQVSLISQLYGVVTMLVFFAINGHHFVFHALAESFHRVPAVGFYPGAGLIDGLMRLTSGMFATALQVALPVVAALLLASAALGILGRVVPQMNVLLMSFPVTMGVGLLVVGASLSLFVGLFADQVRALDGTLNGLVRAMARPGP
ncbi:MAG: flagellar biosynthetic protein FliR [Nitrospirota bacterium]